MVVSPMRSVNGKQRLSGPVKLARVRPEAYYPTMDTAKQPQGEGEQ